LQVLVAARVFLGQRVNLHEKYDYPNGSFVSFEGKPEIQVHHEELTLVGQGCVAFGQPSTEAAQVVSFRCTESAAAVR
jgi:hypothetical protein